MNMQLVKCLSYVATACLKAPEETDTKELRSFLSKRGISGDELDAMLERKCTDFGAIQSAMARADTQPDKAPAKKKAAKKKAAS